MPTNNYELSIVVPVFNESGGLSTFHTSLLKILKENSFTNFEIIYVDDGSADNSAAVIKKLSYKVSNVRLICFSRNFGKEAALSAGIAAASGSAILMMDSDGQHPVELIPKFIEAWKDGAKVVVGLRTNDEGISWFKSRSSKLFHTFFNMLSSQEMVSGATDFRLIDKAVQEAFASLSESERITRGLIDWLGFDRKYINFKAKARQTGQASYSTGKLIGLAANSFASLTPKPMYIFGVLGVVITTLAFILGVAVFVEQILFSDPLHWKFTGTSELGILLLFLVGIVLMSQGILSVYVSHIHNL